MAAILSWPQCVNQWIQSYTAEVFKSCLMFLTHIQLHCTEVRQPQYLILLLPPSASPIFCNSTSPIFPSLSHLEKARLSWTQDPLHEWFLHNHSNSMQKHLAAISVLADILLQFCTCHDSIAVMACAKFCSKYFIWIWVRIKWIFQMWHKVLVTWATVP